MKRTTITCLIDGLFFENIRHKRIYKFEEIVYFEYDSPYVKIISLKRKKDDLYTSIAEIAKVLPQNFILCNQSCIVNLDHAVDFEQKKSKSTLTMSTGKAVDIPRLKVKSVKNRFIEAKQGMT